MANGDGGLGDFLHPKSMLTPGATGGATLMITNTLGSVFQLELGYVALVVSALFGVLLWALTESAAFWQRIVFFLLNTLIIFCVAMGSNTAGQKITQARTQTASFSLFAPAFAQSPEADAMADKLVEELQSIAQDPNLTAQQKLNEITTELKTGEPAQSDSLSGSKGFFRAWDF